MVSVYTGITAIFFIGMVSGYQYGFDRGYLDGMDDWRDKKPMTTTPTQPDEYD